MTPCAMWSTGLIVIWAIAAIVATSLRKGSSPVVSYDADANDAIDTLTGLGYQRSDAERRVLCARLDCPACDFNELVNRALRGYESHDY